MEKEYFIYGLHPVTEAIKSGKVGSYVCDFPEEELLTIPNVICMPHLGASTEEAEENCAP